MHLVLSTDDRREIIDQYSVLRGSSLSEEHKQVQRDSLTYSTHGLLFMLVYHGIIVKKKKKRNMSLPLERSIYNIGNFKLGHISFGPKPLQSRFMIMVELSIREVFVMSSGPTK